MEKTILLNWDDPSDLKKNITILQRRRKLVLERLGVRAISFNSTKFNSEHIMPYLDIMYDQIDYSYIVSKNNYKKYYIYFHCNPLKKLNVLSNLKHLFLASKFGLTHEPFYVGKGENNRAYDLNRNDSHRKIRSEIRKKDKEIIVVIGEKNLSESEALHKEGALFDILGLKSLINLGLLVNLDEGLKVDRFNQYDLHLEREKIKKILNINRTSVKNIKSQSNPKTDYDVSTIKYDNELANSNLEKLKLLHSKYPSASSEFILQKAHTSHKD